MIGTRFKFDEETWIVVRPIKSNNPDFGWVARREKGTQEKWFLNSDLENKV